MWHLRTDISSKNEILLQNTDGLLIIINEDLINLWISHEDSVPACG